MATIIGGWGGGISRLAHTHAMQLANRKHLTATAGHASSLQGYSLTKLSLSVGRSHVAEDGNSNAGECVCVSTAEVVAGRTPHTCLPFISKRNELNLNWRAWTDLFYLPDPRSKGVSKGDHVFSENHDVPWHANVLVTTSVFENRRRDGIEQIRDRTSRPDLPSMVFCSAGYPVQKQVLSYDRRPRQIGASLNSYSIQNGGQ